MHNVYSYICIHIYKNINCVAIMLMFNLYLLVKSYYLNQPFSSLKYFIFLLFYFYKNWPHQYTKDKRFVISSKLPFLHVKEQRYNKKKLIQDSGLLCQEVGGLQVLSRIQEPCIFTSSVLLRRCEPSVLFREGLWLNIEPFFTGYTQISLTVLFEHFFW